MPPRRIALRRPRRLPLLRGSPGAVVVSSTFGGTDSRPRAAWVDWQDPVSAARELRRHAPRRGTRGLCRGWSRAVRKRFMLAEREIDYPKGARWLLVTLTYPGDLTTLEHETGCLYSPLLAGSVCSCRHLWKARLDAFARRWYRRFGDDPLAIWAKEFQKRGVVHYHLCLLRPDEELWRVRHFVSRAWYELVGSRDERHLAAGTNVKAADSHHGLSEYLKREVGKWRQKMPPAGLDAPGRMWGIWGLSRQRVELRFRGESEFHRLRRLVRRYVSAHRRARARELRRAGRAPRGLLSRYAGNFALASGPWRARRDWRLFQDVLRYLELARGSPPRLARLPGENAPRRRRTAWRRWRW